jgi:hypothetical protein
MQLLKDFLERFIKTLDNLPVTELAKTIISKIGDKFLDMKDNKIVNLGAPTGTNDAVSKGYVDTSIANAIAAHAPPPQVVNEVSEDAISKSTADITYLKLDGTSVMGGGLNMGRYGISQLRDPSLGSDVSTKGYTDRAISTKITELSNSLFTDRLIGSYSGGTDTFFNNFFIQLNSPAGNTLKLVITLSIETSDQDIIYKKFRSTHFVSTFIEDRNTHTGYANVTILKLPLFEEENFGQGKPIDRLNIKEYHAVVRPFDKNSTTLNIEFLIHPSIVKHIKAEVYKSYA